LRAGLPAAKIKIVTNVTPNPVLRFPVQDLCGGGRARVKCQRF